MINYFKKNNNNKKIKNKKTEPCCNSFQSMNKQKKIINSDAVTIDAQYMSMQTYDLGQLPQPSLEYPCQ